jgi:hypothetical protein
VELIDLLRLSGELSSLSLPKFCDTQPLEQYDEELGDMPQWESPQSFSQPLEQAARHWQKLLLGDIYLTSKLPEGILDFLDTYEQIEDLSIPLPTQMWPQFRDHTIPQLRSLQRLFLVGEDNARRYDYRELELEYNNFERDTVENHNELGQKLIMKVGAVYASRTADMARDLFQNNRQSIAQGDERALLKHLGDGGDTHTCILLPTGASHGLARFSIEMAGQIWDYHVVKLTSDEAAVFDTLQEWYEGMERLKGGGDEGTIW